MRAASMTSTLIITTVGRVQLTGSEDLVGFQNGNSEILMTASEFEELAERYTKWKSTRNDPPRKPCPECAEGFMAIKWSGTACDRCTYWSCF